MRHGLVRRMRGYGQARIFVPRHRRTRKGAIRRDVQEPDAGRTLAAIAARVTKFAANRSVFAHAGNVRQKDAGRRTSWSFGFLHLPPSWRLLPLTSSYGQAPAPAQRSGAGCASRSFPAHALVQPAIDAAPGHAAACGLSEQIPFASERVRMLAKTRRRL